MLGETVVDDDDDVAGGVLAIDFCVNCVCGDIVDVALPAVGIDRRRFTIFVGYKKK